MAYPTGQLLSGPVTNGSPAAKFGTHVDYLGTGGYRTLATIGQRDAIPVKNAVEYDGQGSGMRRHLMLVGVQETDTIYVLSIPGYNNMVDADRLIQLANNDNWMLLVDYLGAGMTMPGYDIYDVPEDLREDVVTGTYNASNEVTSQVSVGSLPGMKFSYQYHTYEFMPGDAGTLTWVRTRK